jgi:hypothetical protein
MPARDTQANGQRPLIVEDVRPKPAHNRRWISIMLTKVLDTLVDKGPEAVDRKTTLRRG